MTDARACQVKDCKRPYRAKGYCGVHYTQWRQGGMPKHGRYKCCTEENCRQPRAQRGLCTKHWQKARGIEATPESAPAAE